MDVEIGSRQAAVEALLADLEDREQSILAAIRAAQESLELLKHERQALLANQGSLRTQAQPPGPPSVVRLDHLPLYPWQAEAIDTWRSSGEQGVIEAVTGAGKTRVGIHVIAHALRQVRRAVVLVPTRVLQSQWHRVLTDSFPHHVVRTDYATPAWHVLITTPQSFNRRFIADDAEGALLIADECHRYGAETFARALLPGFSSRLGLSATAKRGDPGDDTLTAYFGGIVFRLGYGEALDAGVIAPYRIAFAGVDLAPHERSRYDDAGERMRKARRRLVSQFGFDATDEMALLRSAQAAAEGRSAAMYVARAYLQAFGERRSILASCKGKTRVLAAAADVVRERRGTLVFTQTRESADQAARVLGDRGCRAQSVHSASSREEREENLVALGSGDIAALAAPRILDEGVDVPDVDLGFVLARSRSRRQMIQRLGRLVRRKPDGRSATLVVVFANGTSEDPQLGEEPPEFDELRPHASAVLMRNLEQDGVDDLLAFIQGKPLPVAKEKPTPLPPHEEVTDAPREQANSPRPGLPSNVPDDPAGPERRTRGDKAPRGQGDKAASPPRRSDDEDGMALCDGDESDAPPPLLTSSGATADPVKDYLKQIGKVRLLNAAQEVELAKRIEAGLYAQHRLNSGDFTDRRTASELRRVAEDGRDAKRHMLEANLRLVTSIAKRYTGQGMLFLDLIQEGNLGLIRAVEKFDYRQGTKFSTYATWWIRQAIRRAIDDQARAVRVPVHVLEDARAVDLARRRAGLSWREILATPSRSGGSWTYEQLDAARRALTPVLNLDDIPDDLAELSAPDALEDVLRAEGHAFLMRLAQARLAQGSPDRRLWHVLELRNGLTGGDPMTLEEIGRVFGITRERVRQLEALAMRLLREDATLQTHAWMVGA